MGATARRRTFKRSARNRRGRRMRERWHCTNRGQRQARPLIPVPASPLQGFLSRSALLLTFWRLARPGAPSHWHEQETIPSRFAAPPLEQYGRLWRSTVRSRRNTLRCRCVCSAWAIGVIACLGGAARCSPGPNGHASSFHLLQLPPARASNYLPFCSFTRGHETALVVLAAIMTTWYALGGSRAPIAASRPAGWLGFRGTTWPLPGRGTRTGNEGDLIAATGSVVPL